MLRRVAKQFSSKLSYQARRGFSSLDSSSSSANRRSNTNSDTVSSNVGGDQPKWMKFFVGQEPMQIDLERSMKSENLDLIQSHIKANYMKFKDDQLVAVLPKISRSPLIDKIKAEIRSRILTDSFILTIEQGCKLVEYLEEINYNDRLIVLYALATLSEQLQNLKHLQLYRVVHLALKINKISYPISRAFLDSFEGLEIQDIADIFESLDHQTATAYIVTLAKLQELFTGDILQEAQIQTIIEIYLDKLRQFNGLNEIASLIQLDKVFNPEVLCFFNSDQKIEFKKIAIKAIELRFDSENQLGKFAYYKGDRNVTVQKALDLLKSLVQSNENVMVQKALVEIGNSILSREANDFKFDFRLFSYLSKFNFAYKFYIDESFISIKNMLRSQLSSSKRSFSEESDYNGYHFLLSKCKTYSELNYGQIIQNSDDVYTRRVDFSDPMSNQWNQFQQNLQDCLRDYLSYQLQTGLVDKIVSKMPTREEIENNDDHEEDILDDNDLTLSEDGGILNQATISDERAIKRGEIYSSEWVQSDRDGFIGSSSVDSTNEQTGNLNNDDDYTKRVGYKLIELQRKLQSNKYVKYTCFQDRTSFAQTAFLRYFICTLDSVAHSLYSCEPTEEFLAVLKVWIKQEKMVEIIERFGMVPGILENLLMIEAFGKITKNQTWLSPELRDIIMKQKVAAESILSKEKAYRQRLPQSYLQTIEKEISLLQDSNLPLDQAYDENHSIINTGFYVSRDRVESQKQKIAEASENRIKMQKKRDFMTEQFILSKENLLRKVIHSTAFNIFVNESHLKKFTGDVLFNFAPTTQKNVVFFPFFADFILPQKKIVVQVREKKRLVGGVENTLTGFHQFNEEFLKKIGYKVVYVQHEDFEIDFNTFQMNLLSKIFKSIS